MTTAPQNNAELRKLLEPVSKDRPLWLQVGTLLDGMSDSPLRDGHIVYDAQAIRYVGPADQGPPASVLGPNQKTPDARLEEYTVLPGLIEAHAHLFLDGAPVDREKRKTYLQQETDWMHDRARARLEKLVATGVIAVRDAGDNRGIALALQRAQKSRKHEDVPWPLITSSGPAVHRKGRYGSFLSINIEDYESPAACVEALAQQGARQIKLITTGIINFKKGAVTAPPQMNAEEISAFVRAAKKLGLQVMAHATGQEGVENCIQGNVDSIEHGFFLTRDQLARMRDQSIAWIPTFIPVQSQVDRFDEAGWEESMVPGLKRILEGHAKSLCLAHEMGVRVIAGSDAGSSGVAHGLGLLDELGLMEKAGMPSLAVLNAATGLSSSFLDLGEAMGSLKKGRKPWFILTQHSPLEKISLLCKEKIIVYGSHILENNGKMSAQGL